MRVGYVLKRYPRYSETFIVNEILAHEEAGLEIEIFALRPPSDTRFQDCIARVRAPVRYIPPKPASASALWQGLRAAREAGVAFAITTDAHDVEQLDRLRLGVIQARRGWLEKGDVLNTRTLGALRRRLRRRNAAASLICPASAAAPRST